MMDIVESLEDGQVCSAAENWCRNRPAMEQAADEITRLRATVKNQAQTLEHMGALVECLERADAENERLREALVPAPERLMELVDTVLHDMGEPMPPWSKQKLRVFYWGVARAALHREDR